MKKRHRVFYAFLSYINRVNIRLKNSFHFLKIILEINKKLLYNDKGSTNEQMAVKWEVADTLKGVVTTVNWVFPRSKSIQGL